MKANELRIGNIISEFGIPKTVTPNRILRLYQIELAGKIAIDCTPIPLTPEILVKAGFVKTCGFWNKTIPGQSGVKELSIMLENKTLTITDVHDDMVNIKLPELVHQLQNLYFALTGEELNIEL
jgi:hypothetical protein